MTEATTGGMGPVWRTSYDRWIGVITGTPTAAAAAYRGDGDYRTFTLVGSAWVGRLDSPERLVQQKDGNGDTTGWQYVTATDDVEQYDGNGLLQSITQRTGATQTLSYSTVATPPSIAPFAGLLLTVVDPLGRQLNFTYDNAGRIATMVDPAGRTYTYGYDASSRLISAAFPGGALRQYLYEYTAPSDPRSAFSLLTGIVDENGNRYATYGYDTFGRVTSELHGTNADQLTLAYTSAYATTTITDALGTVRQLSFTTIKGISKSAGISQPCASCGITSSAIAYDANGNVASRTDFNSKMVCYSYDLARNLETARLEGALSTETCATVLATPPNRPDVRKVVTTWHPTWRLPATMVEPAPGGSKTTTFTYDPTTGDLTQKSIVAPKNDGTGATVTRTWQWTYYSSGRVHTAIDPNNKTTTTTYYADNDPDLGKRGNVATITNPLGHLTQITAYDLNGRPLSITDANGLVTTLGYHPRGWLTSRQVGAELTVYDYDGVGQLNKVTLPDSSYLQYTYDDAHRLTQINDGLNNKIVYTLDAMGNRIKEEAFDPSSILARTRQQVYDSLNRLHQSVGAQ